MAGSKRQTTTTSPAARKRARAPAAAPPNGAASDAMWAASQRLEKEAPALWANLAEFRAELVPRAPHAYGSERAYLKHLELLVYLRALRVTLAATLHDSSCRVDIVKIDTKQGTGWEGNGDSRNEKASRREDRDGLQRRLEVVDAFLTSCQQWRDARLEATERKPRLYRLARAYDLEANGRDDRLFTCLCVMAACQTDAVRCTLIEDDHARRANLLCRLAVCMQRPFESAQNPPKKHSRHAETETRRVDGVTPSYPNAGLFGTRGRGLRGRRTFVRQRKCRFCERRRRRLLVAGWHSSPARGARDGSGTVR